jgi:hypothetical protein
MITMIWHAGSGIEVKHFFNTITVIKQELILSQFKIENEQINHSKVKFVIHEFCNRSYCIIC